MGSEAETTSAASILVLLCGDLKSGAGALGLTALADGLSSAERGVRVQIQDSLCRDPGVIRDALRSNRPRRLVLGLCSGEYPELEVQAHVRKAGLDPLSIQAVDLGHPCSGAAAPMATARLLLKAAIAHATAFPGSRPDNLKSVFLPGQQKVSRRALFTLPPVSYVPVPTINHALCAADAGCQQCMDACPHVALAKDSSFVTVDRDRCQSCGACVAACPPRAVEFPGWSAEELEAQVTAILSLGMTTSERAVAFVCQKAAAPKGDGWLPVKVPCLAMVPAGAILATLAQGATAVALLRCEENCCASQGELVRGRVDYCRQLLSLIGDQPQRVQLVDGSHTAPRPPLAAGLVPAVGRATRASEPVRLFGSVATAHALLALTARGSAETDIELEHPHSPLGRVRIDARACTACGACANGCPTGALSYQYQDEAVSLTFDHADCIACGQCVPLCPERAAGAIEMSRVTDCGLLSAGRQVLVRDQGARCQQCGAHVASRRALKRVAELLGPAFNERLGALCTECRGLSA